MKIFKRFKKKPLTTVLRILNMSFMGAIIATLFTGVLYYFYMTLAAVAMLNGLYIHIDMSYFYIVYGLATGWFTVWTANRRGK